MEKITHIKPLVLLLSAALLAATTFSGPAEAMHIPAPPEQRSASGATSSPEQQTDIARVQKTLESRIVRQKLLDLGLSPEEASARVKKLSPEQVHQLAQHSDALQAGGNPAAVIIDILIALAALQLVAAVMGCIFAGIAIAKKKSESSSFGFRTDDLDQDFVKEFQADPDYFYKFDPRYSVDYMVGTVRSGVLSSTDEDRGEILLSVGLIGKEKSFDCELFYSKLSEEEKNLVNSRMENHPFICRQPGYTAESALASFPKTVNTQTNSYLPVDGTWAWFDATGDAEALKRLLDNYLYNPDACFSCIEWSYRYNADHNADVKRYLLDYMKDKTEPEKDKLGTLLQQQ